MDRAISAAPLVSAGSVKFGNDLPISIIAGPCQLESRAHALEVASALKEIASRLGIGLVYKTSFDKANRTSASAARGIGLREALPIFAEIRSSLGLPVLTDVHEIEQCARAAQAVEVLQMRHAGRYVPHVHADGQTVAGDGEPGLAGRLHSGGLGVQRMQLGDVGRGRAVVVWCGLRSRDGDGEADGTRDPEYAWEMHSHDDPLYMVFVTRTDAPE